MASTEAEIIRVYLACRAIFSGNKALLRKQKAVRKVVEQRSEALRPLTNDLGKSKVVLILQDLLAGRIFESENRARIAFPKLFHSSPEQDTYREASEIDAAKSAAKALSDVASADQQVDGEDVETALEEQGEARKEEPACDELACEELVCEELACEEPACEEPACDEAEKEGDFGKVNQDAPHVLLGLPSLYPVHVPYTTQHLILNEVQRILEEACYDFAQKWASPLLAERGWDCASSVELNKWTRLFFKGKLQIPGEAFNVENSRIGHIAVAASKIRHSAVHRLRTTARGLRDLCHTGVELASALRDDTRAAMIAEISNALEEQLRAMSLNKNVLENTAAAEVAEIHRLREELDRREKQVIHDMLQKDAANRTMVGSLLEDTVNHILLGNLGSQDSMDDTDGPFNEADDELTANGKQVAMQEYADLNQKINNESKEEDGIQKNPHKLKDDVSLGLQLLALLWYMLGSFKYLSVTIIWLATLFKRYAYSN
ncbi:hypothetical protein F5Y19DRAFT_246414 [Xylariaceae sp. FL1651]|nr:hypothetical protein F5Y19DRAFT_246414 [Xylariaceae sp. FL1651]